MHFLHTFQLQPAVYLQMSPLAIYSDGNSDSKCQDLPPFVLNTEKSVHISSSDNENIPARSAAVHVDVSTLNSQTAVHVDIATSNSQTDVSEVIVGQCMIVVVTPCTGLRCLLKFLCSMIIVDFITSLVNSMILFSSIMFSLILSLINHTFVLAHVV